MARIKGHLSKKTNRRTIFGNRRYMRTGLLFCSVAITLSILVHLIARAEYLFFFNILTTKASAALIEFSGLQVQTHDNIIRLANALWIVDTECTAVNLLVIFASFILVYPAPFSAKAAGILVGVPLIFIANVSRLFIMAWMDALMPSAFIYLHDYFWQVAFLILVAFMWLYWIDKVANRASCKPVSP